MMPATAEAIRGSRQEPMGIDLACPDQMAAGALS
jgi:hypothetical protein